MWHYKGETLTSGSSSIMNNGRIFLIDRSNWQWLGVQYIHWKKYIPLHSLQQKYTFSNIIYYHQRKLEFFIKGYLTKYEIIHMNKLKLVETSKIKDTICIELCNSLLYLRHLFHGQLRQKWEICDGTTTSTLNKSTRRPSTPIKASLLCKEDLIKLL